MKNNLLLIRKIPKLTKIFIVIWILTIIVFIFLFLLLARINSNIQDNFINYILLLDIIIGIFAFLGIFVSFLLGFIVKRLNINLNKPVTLDKWYLLAIIAVIIFAWLFYFKITKDSEIKQKEETITVMKCLQLGSDNARKACLIKYKPTK